MVKIKTEKCPYCHGTVDIMYEDVSGVQGGITQCNALGGCHKEFGYKITVGIVKVELFNLQSIEKG